MWSPCGRGHHGQGKTPANRALVSFGEARVSRSQRSADRDFRALLRELRPALGLPRGFPWRRAPRKLNELESLRALIHRHLEANGFEGVWLGNEIILWCFPRLVPRLIGTGCRHWRPPLLGGAASCTAACAPVRAEPPRRCRAGHAASRRGTGQLRKDARWVEPDPDGLRLCRMGPRGSARSRRATPVAHPPVTATFDEARAYRGAPYE